jgi:hypothetical protein
MGYFRVSVPPPPFAAPPSMRVLVPSAHNPSVHTTHLTTRPLSFAFCCAAKPETRADIEVARLSRPRKRCGLGRR